MMFFSSGPHLLKKNGCKYTRYTAMKHIAGGLETSPDLSSIFSHGRLVADLSISVDTFTDITPWKSGISFLIQ